MDYTKLARIELKERKPERALRPLKQVLMKEAVPVPMLMLVMYCSFFAFVPLTSPLLNSSGIVTL